MSHIIKVIKHTTLTLSIIVYKCYSEGQYTQCIDISQNTEHMDNFMLALIGNCHVKMVLLIT